MEIWQRVPGFGNHYEASSLGRIRSKARVVKKWNYKAKKIVEQRYLSKILGGSSGKFGHIKLHISVNGRKISTNSHILVLLAFKGARPKGMEACHNNGVASDNRPENLRWDTHLNNNKDRKKHGRYAARGEHVMAKLTESKVRKIRLSSKSGKELSKIMGIGTSQISRIRNGKSWVG